MSDDLPSFVRGLFPAASARLQALHQSVVDNNSLLPVDFLSVQDLLAVPAYADESLHVLLLLMFLALQEGSLCVEISPAALADRLADLAGSEQADFWTTAILGDLKESRFPRLIAASPQDSRPLVLCIRGEKQFLYFHKYLRSEMALCDELRQRITGFGPLPQTAVTTWDWQSILHDVLVQHPLQLTGGPLRLDAEQKLALERCLNAGFVIVSGGPGTGKTSIVLTLLRCLMRGGMKTEQIALAAPTGRAAQRLTDSLRSGLEKIVPEPAGQDLLLHSLQAGTLHQLLEYSSTRGTFRRHRENPLTADVVIVDEVSMVGVVLMAQLLQALRPECKLILLGDKDQLPSVEAGAVLANLVGEYSHANPKRERGPSDSGVPSPEGLAYASASDRAPTTVAGPEFVVLLRTNHRSQAQIQATAAAINRQEADVVARLPTRSLPADDASGWWQTIESEGGCWLLEPAPAQTAELRRVLQCWANRHFLGRYAELIARCNASVAREPESADGKARAETDVLLAELFRLLDSNRILTLVREGSFGCVGINQYLDAVLRPRLDRGSRSHLFAGSPVLITANDHQRQLYNGDVGVVLRYSDANRQVLRAVFPRRAGYASFAVESLPSHELGLALTVHKSQGSEYDNVLLVLPPSGGRRLLTKEILYTGVTRARKLVLIAGTQETIKLAVSRKITRESGLGWSLGTA